jgi:peptidoglycan/LPS O-acetylase OafA/YrhL
VRNLGLDLLRILAVLLVMCRHFDIGKNPSFLLAALHKGGWVGVDLFFVLSGFLVSGLIFQEHSRKGEVNMGRFLIRRGFKIYPVFWIMIGVTILVDSTSGLDIPTQLVLGELLFLQNYLGGLWSHTWSLAVEEHFYFGIAFLFFFLIKRNPDKPFSPVPQICLFIGILCLCLRVYNTWALPAYSHHTHLFPTHIRIDSMFFGLFLSYLFHYKNLEATLKHIPSMALYLGGLGLLLPAFSFSLENHQWISNIGLVLFYVGSGCLVLAAIRIETSTNPILLFLGALGSASYSIYLWHMPIHYWTAEKLQSFVGESKFSLYLAAYVFIACLIGYFVSQLIEWPVLKLRDRLFPSATTMPDMKPFSRP